MSTLPAVLLLALTVAPEVGDVDGSANLVRPPPPCFPSPFLDVPASSPFCPWIREIVTRQVMSVCASVDLFCPGLPVTREQLALYLGRSQALPGKLWGQGRPGAIRHGHFVFPSGEELCKAGEVSYGLSFNSVDWAGAAAACPAGTWVCREIDLEPGPPCNTVRYDGVCDYRNCDGACLDASGSSHPGWVADTGGEFFDADLAHAWREGADGPDQRVTCMDLPVWCCSD